MAGWTLKAQGENETLLEFAAQNDPRGSIPQMAIEKAAAKMGSQVKALMTLLAKEK